MSSMWGTIEDFAEERKPEDILREQFDELSSLTEGAVIGRVERYEKSLEDMTAPISKAFDSMHTTLAGSPQQYLGEIIEGAALTFEAYVTARRIPNYRYRFLFLQHGIKPYPVIVEIEQDIADSLETDIQFECSDETEFVESLGSVLGSQRVMHIVSRLAAYR